MSRAMERAGHGGARAVDAASGDAVGLRRVLGDRRGRGNGQGVHRVARPVCFGLRPAEWPTSLIVALASWFRREVEESLNGPMTRPALRSARESSR